MARKIERGDWIDLRVEVTRRDERTLTVWLSIRSLRHFLGEP
jgi:hypothetical protein